MKYIETELNGSYLIELEKKIDDRGFFARIYCNTEFEERKLNNKWLQVNNSLTIKKGTLRGLHFQYPPKAEIKLVRCIQGKIWDVIVDIRQDSLTFGKWFGAELSAINKTSMYVPKGFAHGFVSLEDNSEVVYLVSELYDPKLECTLLWNDKKIDIDWPTEVKMISKKDELGKTLDEIEPLKI